MADIAIVFGGSGFLGSHVADALTLSGYKVRIFDRLPSPYLQPTQEMIVGDIQDAEAVRAAARGCRFVFNFAGVSDIEEARKQPAITAQINIIGNLNVLEAARATSAERFIFASTVYVFSEAGSFYRASKQACERFVECYADEYGLKYSILRYGTLYGRRANDNNGIHRFIKQALSTGKIEYVGNAEAMREYIHVKDAANLSLHVLDKKFENCHVIITGQERLAVKSLMQMISEMMPKAVDIQFLNNIDKSDGHYVMTPYSFSPKIGQKITTNEHIDIGQGLLDCMAEIYESLPQGKNHK